MSDQNSSSDQLSNAFKKLDISKPLDKKKDEYLKTIRSQKRKGLLKNKRLAAFNSLSNQLDHINIQEEDTLGQGLSLQEFLADCQERTFILDQLSELVSSIYSPNLYRQYFGVIGIRKLLTIASPPIHPVIDAGVIPRLVELLCKEDEHYLQAEAAWALSNLSSGTTEQTQQVVESGAISELIKLLKSPQKDPKTQAIWTLGNIAADNVDFRDIIIQEGAMGPLIKIMEEALSEGDEQTISQGNWALSNLCRGRPSPPFEDIKDALPVFAKVIVIQEDPDVLMDALWGLSPLSDGGEERIQQVLDTGVVPFIVKHTENNSAGFFYSYVRILGNLLTGNNQQVDTLLAVPGLLENLFKALKNPLETVRREAAWALSNIAAGTSDHLEYILGNPEYLDQLISMGLNDAIEVRKEVAWIFSNALNNANQEQLSILFDKKIIVLFGKIIEENVDHKAKEVGLEGILKILTWKKLRNHEESFGDDCWSFQEKAQIISAIRKLRSHPNARIYELVDKILRYVDNGED